MSTYGIFPILHIPSLRPQSRDEGGGEDQPEAAEWRTVGERRRQREARAQPCAQLHGRYHGHESDQPDHRVNRLPLQVCFLSESKLRP